MATSLGSPFWLLVVWLVMAAMALSGALIYGEIASRFPVAGGGYVYLRVVYGPRPVEAIPASNSARSVSEMITVSRE